MGLRIYNTLTRKKEVFEPVQPGKVAMYVCGVTVYDMSHIGHGRSVVLFDVIFRYLRTKYDVTYVRNFTDVDDKIINRANQLGENWKHLAERYVQEFYTDMDALGVLRPNYQPKATEHISEILDLIQKLVAKGHAYVMDGDVMFSVSSFKQYGKLSGKKLDELISGARVEVDERKRDPLDFALWKAAKPGEPHWGSPWGPGRPGWHIECSAMSMAYLGEQFDIHGGGADLTFPHHENEIAQSEAATGKPFARYWIHNGFVNIRAEKMSKSLGNVLNIRDILKEIHPETLRLFLLSSHYRSPLDYNETSMREAASGLERLYAAMAGLDDLMKAGGEGAEMPAELTNIKDRFVEAMDDDFNTPKCLAILFEAARAINRMASAPDSAPAPEALTAVKNDLIGMAREVLGLLNEQPESFLENIRKKGAEALAVSEQEILDLIAQRADARKNRKFSRADEIRNELAAAGILLEDGPEGTTWRVKD